MIAWKISSGDINSPMTAKKSWADGVVEAIKARLITVVVWVIIVAAIYGAIQVNRYNHAVTVAHLSSKVASIRIAEILKWSHSEQVADALASTEDPNSDDKSPINVRSASIRETCAADYVTSIKSGGVPDIEAMNNLYALHKDSNAKVQAAAITGLTFLGLKSPANIDKIVNRLADGDPDVRGAASDTLGKIGGPIVLVKLIAAVNGTPAGAKDDALATLPKVGIPASPYVISLLGTPDAAFKGKLISILGGIADPKSIPTLEMEALAQPRDPQIRRLALLNLASVVVATIPTPASIASAAASAAKAAASGTPPAPSNAPTADDVKTALAAAPVLIGALNNHDDDSRARAQCALALGRIKSGPAIASLVLALGDIDTHISQGARTGLESVGPAAVPALAAAVKSPDEQVRGGAAYALGGIGNASALSALMPSLTDPSTEVRRSVCEALGYSSNPEAIPLLVARLADPNGFVAGAAATSLVDIGKPAIPALVAVLGSSNPTAPIYGSQALQAIGAEAGPLVMAAARTGSPNQKTWCAVVLGWLHDPTAKPLLEELAVSSDPATSFAAKQALEQFTAG